MDNSLKLNLINFVALMGTSALAIATKSIINNSIGYYISLFLEISIIFIFLYQFSKFCVHIFSEDFKKNMKNPMLLNLYPAIGISSALISIMLSTIKLPLSSGFLFGLDFAFYLIALILSLIFVVIVPINLKLNSKIEQLLPTWFLAPVGLFVLITAGSNLALSFGYFLNIISLLNLLIFGPAFVLYFLTLNLVYFRSKFYNVDSKFAPTFNIVLAPVGVSILAILSTAKLFLKSHYLNLNLINFAKLYSVIMFGYGLWVVFGLILFYIRINFEKERFSFTELWWAFIFPLGAFILATLKLSSIVNFIFVADVLYIILVYLWFYVFIKYVLQIFTHPKKID